MKINKQKFQKHTIIILIILCILYIPIYYEIFIGFIGGLYHKNRIIYEFIIPLRLIDIFLSIIPWYLMLFILILLLGFHIYLMKKEKDFDTIFLIIYLLCSVWCIYGAHLCYRVVQGWMSV